MMTSEQLLETLTETASYLAEDRGVAVALDVLMAPFDALTDGEFVELGYDEPWLEESLLGLVGFDADTAPPSDLVALGDRAFRRGEPEAAADRYERALDRGAPEAHTGLAVLSKTRGDFEAFRRHTLAGLTAGVEECGWMWAEFLGVDDMVSDLMDALVDDAELDDVPNVYREDGEWTDDLDDESCEVIVDAMAGDPDARVVLGKRAELALDFWAASEWFAAALAVDPDHVAALVAGQELHVCTSEIRRNADLLEVDLDVLVADAAAGDPEAVEVVAFSAFRAHRFDIAHRWATVAERRTPGSAQGLLASIEQHQAIVAAAAVDTDSASVAVLRREAALGDTRAIEALAEVQAAGGA